jgi:hypothetical protein
MKERIKDLDNEVHGTVELMNNMDNMLKQNNHCINHPEKANFSFD